MKNILVDVVGVVGLGLLAFGAWQVYQPAAPIVVGVLLISWAIKMGSK